MMMASKTKAVRNQHPGSNSIGAMVPDGWNTRSAAARAIGRDPDTLKGWHRKSLQGKDEYDDLSPSGQMKAGMLVVWLYSDNDITRIQNLLAERAGTPRRTRSKGA